MTTREEHTARAMLLGRIYIDWANIYVDAEDWERVDLKHPVEWLDADTLLPVEPEEKLDRLLARTRESWDKEDSVPALVELTKGRGYFG